MDVLLLNIQLERQRRFTDSWNNSFPRWKLQRRNATGRKAPNKLIQLPFKRIHFVLHRSSKW